MKVYVMTKAVPFGKEEYVGVKNSKKSAEKAFREMFPHMKTNTGTIVSDAANTYMLFIHEEEV